MRFATVAAVFTAPLLVSAIPMKVKRASDNDKLVLQFAEVLERLETQFYQEALGKFVEADFIAAGITVPDVAIQNFQAILSHEQAHTAFLDSALEHVGAEPVPGCTFSFDAALTDVATMAAVARVVEAVGVGAYLGASLLVDDKNILAAAASILTIEARHQTFLNTLNGGSAVPQAFDIALSPDQVLSIAGGFIQGCSLGIEPSPTLTITNTGPVAIGTLLTFSPESLNGVAEADVSCQMLIGNADSAISLPLAECVVPEGINGPVAIFLTNSNQPIPANLNDQDASTIVSGPTIAFIDSQPDALAALVRAGTGPVDSQEQITPDQAQGLIDNANNNGQVTDPTLDPAAGQVTDPSLDPAAGQVTDPSLDPAQQQTPQITDPSLDPAAPPPAPENAAAPPPAPENAGAAPPTAAPPIKVVGLSTIPA
jgi:hypothetical protein